MAYFPGEGEFEHKFSKNSNARELPGGDGTKQEWEYSMGFEYIDSIRIFYEPLTYKNACGH